MDEKKLMALMEQIELWEEAEEYQKIIDSIEAIPQEEKDYDLTMLLALAYNMADDETGTASLEKVVELLSTVAEEGEDDPQWQFQMGYALFYLDQEEEALICFQKAAKLDPEDMQAREYIRECEKYIAGDYVEPELYEEDELDAVERHIAQYYGAFETVMHELVSPDIHVDICLIPPAKDRDYITLVTMGMGAHAMNVPEDLAEHGINPAGLKRAELLITLPSDWKLDQESMQDEKWYWPLRLLKMIARLPGEQDTWVGWGHTIALNDDEFYAENTRFCGVMLTDQEMYGEDADVCELPKGDVVNFYQLIPIYREEMEFKCENGADALMEKLEQYGHVININRPNAVKTRERETEYSYYVNLKLNARFQPMHRHGLEDALEDVLDSKGLGCVSGGGTLQLPSGEVESCDIELEVRDGNRETIEEIAKIVNDFGIPKGSELTAGDMTLAVGELEGMALYINGTDLSDEVYENCDINYVVEQLNTLLEGIGRMDSYWSGPKDTALYFYGVSYEEMLAAVKGFLEEYPLCQKCVVNQIA